MSEKTKDTNQTDSEKKETESTPVVSYHTFIFPFLWKISGDNKTVKSEDFIKCLNPGWCRETIDAVTDEEWFYAQYRYFNTAAKAAIYDNNEKNGIVKNYRFDIACLNGGTGKLKRELSRPKNSDSVANLIIKKVRDEGEGYTDLKSYSYKLKINGIRLKIYNSGIALLIYELENYENVDIEAINRINEFGRRLYMPYKASDNCPLCADNITIEYNGEKIVSVISGFKTINDYIELPNFVTALLCNDQYTITTNAKLSNKRNCFYVEPVIGDRMFVACIYKNPDFVTKLSEWRNDKYVFIDHALNKGPWENDNFASQLYKFIFVDGNGLSCHNRELLKVSLEEHIHSRWLENRYENKPSGTISGITEYSMTCVTSAFVSSVLPPFLTQYIEMVCLVLAQRASLIVFERLISESALKKHKISKIQEEYILFQSQLLLQEVTPEQQGIELYNELLESLFIERESIQIENQLKALFELKNYKNDNMESIILFILAVLGVTETVNCFGDWINLSNVCDGTNWGRLLFTLAIMLAGICVYGFFRRKK